MLSRRRFLGTVGAGLLASTAAVEAQQTRRTFRLGILDNERSLDAPRLAAFLSQLERLGWLEGQNLIIDARIGPRDAFPGFADQLVRLNPDLIFAPKSASEIQASSAGTSIPTVIAAVPDPVGTGLVASLSRPGGNVTGLSSMLGDMGAKQLELLKAAVPRVKRVAVFQNPAHPSTSRMVSELKAAEVPIGVRLTLVPVDSPSALVGAFAQATGARSDALLMLPNALLIPLQAQSAALAVKHRLPAIAVTREAVDAGLLMSYGPDQTDLYRRAAFYVDKILKGAKPAELPIEQPTKFELVINLKTAKALGLTIPPSLLLRADQIIE